MLASMGHNNPPSDMEIVSERLFQQEKALRDDMIFAEVPSVIADEQEAGRITDAIKTAANLKSRVSDIHETVKKPYLECGRFVDAWKKRLEIELDGIRAKYAAPLTAFLDRKAAEERARQIEAARVERERAEKLAAEALAHEQAGINDTADALFEAAASTEIMAERMEEKVHTAPPSQLARTRSITGASAAQRLVWVGEIENISAVDLNQLRNSFTLAEIQKAVNAFIREGGRNLDGVKIEQKAQLSVR